MMQRNQLLLKVPVAFRNLATKGLLKRGPISAEGLHEQLFAAV